MQNVRLDHGKAYRNPQLFISGLSTTNKETHLKPITTLRQITTVKANNNYDNNKS